MNKKIIALLIPLLLTPSIASANWFNVLAGAAKEKVNRVEAKKEAEERNAFNADAYASFKKVSIELKNIKKENKNQSDSLTSLGGRVGGTESVSSDHTKKIEGLDTIQKKNNKRLSSYETEMKRVSDQNIQHSSALEEISNGLVQIQQKQSYTAGAMLKIEESLENHSDAFQAFFDRDEQHEKSLKTLSIQTDSLKANHLANLKRIYDGQEDVGNVKADLEQIDKRSADNSKKSAENKAEIATVGGKLDTRISNASKKINTTTNIANQNTRHIAEQTVKVEKNTLDILKNRQDLRSLENDLRETNERLDNGLAASAALNGLFQPYGVGKLNITAAVGGYQSTQAVAVGTGYRFNENIAVKTGMAYTGSNDVMYNMAVNLEW